MKTLDRYILRNYLTAVLLWFFVLMSLRIIGDLFAHLDEFAESPMSMMATMKMVGHYYLVHSTNYFYQLGKVVLVFAAVTTLFTMNRSNELTAILASGQSLHRVIWPIVLCAMALSCLIIADQELLIPRYAPLLSQEIDDWTGGTKDSQEVLLSPDESGSTWYATQFDARTGRMDYPAVMLRRRIQHGDVTVMEAVGVVSGHSAEHGTLQLLGATVPAPGAATRTTAGESQPAAWRGPRDPLAGWFLSNALLSPRRRQHPWEMNATTQYIASRVTGDTFLAAAAAAKGKVIRPIDEVFYRMPEEGLSLPDQYDVYHNLIIRTSLVTCEKPGKDGRRHPVLHSPQFIFRDGDDGRVIAVVTADQAIWMPPGSKYTVRRVPPPPPKPGQKPKQSPEADVAQVDVARGGFWRIEGGRMFIPSNLTVQKVVVQQSSRWLEFLSTAQLTDLLDRSEGMATIARQAAVTRNTHLADPVNTIILLLLVVPFVLSRERNLKASTFLGIVMGGSFFAFVYLCRYVALSPVLAAGLPIVLFGPIAAVMVDWVKT